MCKVIAVSDLHGHLPDIPEGDILCICGDISPLDIQRFPEEMKAWLSETFSPWLKSLPVKEIYLVAGNHDFVFQDCPDAKNLLPCIYLENSWVISPEFGLKIYGTPWCKKFYNWAFMDTVENLKKMWKDIPDDLDIMISHDSPILGNLGLISDGNWKDTQAGNKALDIVIKTKQPKLFFSGHIHSGSHQLQFFENTKMVNVSYVSENYSPANEPFEIYI